MAEGDDVKTDGDVFFASEANLARKRVLELYTGSALDSVTSSTQSHELTATTFGDSKPTYLKINIQAIMSADCGSTSSAGTASINLKLEVKDIGGSYATIFDRNILNVAKAASSTDRNTAYDNYISLFHTLTANEKANGFQVKLTTTTAEANGGNVDFTNENIIVEQIS